MLIDFLTLLVILKEHLKEARFTSARNNDIPTTLKACYDKILKSINDFLTNNIVSKINTEIKEGTNTSESTYVSQLINNLFQIIDKDNDKKKVKEAKQKIIELEPKNKEEIISKVSKEIIGIGLSPDTEEDIREVLGQGQKWEKKEQLKEKQ